MPSDTPTPRRFLRLAKVQARYGGAGVSTIYNWVANGVIPPPVKTGGTSLWDESELDAFDARRIAERDARRRTG